MPDDQIAVRVRSLTHIVQNRPLFAGLDLTARTGEVHVLEGPSGVGKSTLLRMIGGIERPDNGRITVFGEQVTALRRSALRRYLRHQVGFVFQDAGLVEHWTVRKNIAVALAAAPRVPTSPPLPISAAAGHLDLGQHLLDRRASELSGGERQRVAIARILVRKPRLVLMDEPTAALDVKRTQLVARILRTLADEGAVVLVASHDADLADAADLRSELSEVASRA